MKLKIEQATAQHLLSIIDLGLLDKSHEKIDRIVLHENLNHFRERIRNSWSRKSKTVNVTATQLLCLLKCMNTAKDYPFSQSSVYVCKHYVIDPLLKQLDE